MHDKWVEHLGHPLSTCCLPVRCSFGVKGAHSGGQRPHPRLAVLLGFDAELFLRPPDRGPGVAMGIGGGLYFRLRFWSIGEEFDEEGFGFGFGAAFCCVKQVARRPGQLPAPVDPLGKEIVVAGQWGLKQRVFDTATRGSDIGGDAHEAALPAVIIGAGAPDAPR